MSSVSATFIFGQKTFRRSGFGQNKKATVSNCSVLNMRRLSGTRVKKEFNRKNSQISFNFELKKAWIVLVFSIVFSGTFYLYQVNDLAAKGYELKELQNIVDNLQETNKKGIINEVELMSMYNIEKATQETDLVGLSNATYLELNGPVAMK